MPESSTKHIVVIIYNSFKDPLFQNLLLNYIGHQTLKGGLHFHLITFEQDDYSLNPEEVEKEKNLLLERSIEWTPLTYHSGSMFILKKAFDLFSAWRLCRKIARANDIKGILAFGNAAASFGALLKPTIGGKLIIYGYEPHGLFMVETGEWKQGGIKLKALTKYEQLAERRSDYLLTGTSHYAEVLRKKGMTNVFRAPSCVDQSIFKFDAESRVKIRKELDVENRKVLIYAGKFGGLYYKKQTARFCAGLLKQDPDFFFIILSPQPLEEINQLFNSEGVPAKNRFLGKAETPKEMAEYLSAADIGLNTIPPFPSQRYRSPIKVGEYLMCGLPFITCHGISEDDTYAINHNVGLVVPELSFEQGEQTAEKISSFIAEDREAIRKRCRTAGIEYRGTHIVNELFSKIFDEV
jgi:glycosyltransferase involved in cell wall biosynthesis